MASAFRHARSAYTVSPYRSSTNSMAYSFDTLHDFSTVILADTFSYFSKHEVLLMTTLGRH
jgi:hypothetical protein